MAKTITISLPERLYDDFVKYKTKFNVSRACQEAIAKEIEHLALREKDIGLEAFLLQSKKLHSQSIHKLGRQFARTIIGKRLLDYEGFVALTRLARGKRTADFTCVLDVLSQANQSDAMKAFKAEANELKEFDRELGLDEWLEGFLEEVVGTFEKLGI